MKHRSYCQIHDYIVIVSPTDFIYIYIYIKCICTCPLNGNCLQSSVVYQATVTRQDNNITETYVGLTENDFKTRYRNHTASFRHAKHRNSTELSKYIWTLKDNNINFFISWLSKTTTLTSSSHDSQRQQH